MPPTWEVRGDRENGRVVIMLHTSGGVTIQATAKPADALEFAEALIDHAAYVEAALPRDEEGRA